MSKLDIITLPDPLLRQASAPVERVDDELRELMDNMLETMYIAPGIGLAAVQVAVPRRLIVVDVGEPDEAADEERETVSSEASAIKVADEQQAEKERRPVRKPICLVNPKILTLGDKTRSYEEGCLSLPDVLVDIERPTSLTVQYLDRSGREQILEAEGILATVIQHEIDHLDGKLIIDFLSRLKRDMVIRKFKKMKR